MKFQIGDHVTVNDLGRKYYDGKQNGLDPAPNSDYSRRTMILGVVLGPSDPDITSENAGIRVQDQRGLTHNYRWDTLDLAAPALYLIEEQP